MQHIKQNDLNCLPVVRKIGCFLRSCGLVAEYKTGEKLSANDINNLWHFAKEHKYIDDKDDVKQSAPIITRALRILGQDKGRFIEVGTFSDGVIFWYPSIPSELRQADALIQKVETENKNSHFRVVDVKGCLIEDPYIPTPKVKKIKYSILYKYVEE